MNKKGFTLIELLVVVTIIAILMAIGFVNYRQFVRQAEDAQRKSDLKFIQSALEQYNSDQHYYPPSGSGDCPTQGDGQLRIGCPLTNADGSKKYLTVVPKDPSGSVEYSYVARGVGCSDTDTQSRQKCTNYCLYAKLNYDLGMQDDPGCSDSEKFGVTRP